MIRRTDFGVVFCAGMVLVALECGCQQRARYRSHPNPYLQACTLIVVPFKDISGSPYLEPLVMSDEFVTELSQVEGISVLPVNQVLAKMGELNMIMVASPSDALLLSDALDADGVIAGAVHRWEPYDPPLISLTVQLYMRDDVQQARHSRELHVNPAEFSRAGRPFDMELADPIEAQSQVSRVFDASEEFLVERMQAYAEYKHMDDSPLGWRKVKTQQSFLRFVSHEIVAELMAVESLRVGTTSSRVN